jgi:hypothetical protein
MFPSVWFKDSFNLPTQIQDKKMVQFIPLARQEIFGIEPFT